MKYYSKNILRTVLQNRGSYIGAVVIISIGILVYIAMTEFLNNLQAVVDTYCARNQFADVFAEVESMPRARLELLADVEGVDAVFGRLEGDARMLRDDSSEIITVHLMGWSAEDSMNLLTLRPAPEDVAEDAVYIGANMVKELGFALGDTLKLTANGTTRRYTYAGRVYSPEAMFMLADESASAPDNAIYDVAAMRSDALEALLGKRGVVTAIGIRLAPGYTFSQVKNELEQRLRPYGLNELCARKDEPSYFALVDEVESYELVIAILPTLFMLVTMFILYVVLKKMVDKDRMLIGTLKAFGASNREIVKNYLLLGAGIGIIGGILPIIPGELAGQYLFLDDVDYFAIPYQEYRVDPLVWVNGMLIAMGTALLSLLLGIRDVLRILPAESMKAAAPSATGGLSLPRWADRVLNRRQKLGLRAIFRNLLRSLFIALAVGMPFGMIASFGSFNGVLDQTIYDQFRKAETYELRVRLTDSVSEDAAQAILKKLDGVRASETSGSYSVTLSCRNRSEGAVLVVMNPDSELQRIMDIDGNFFLPRDDGLILSEGFANKLNVTVGDMMEVSGSKLMREGQTAKVPVAQIVRVGFGSGCYISREGLARFFQTSFRPNNLLLCAEEGQLAHVKEQVNALRGVALAVDSERMLRLSAVMMGTTELMLNLMAVFSLVAGIIMIYNIINISMRERRSEFGTLMVLGMRRNEIAEIIIFEQSINFVVGIILGFPVAKFFCVAIEFAVGTDTLSVAMRIAPATYLGSFAICAVAAIVSIFFVIRGVLDIQLTEVLKARD